MRKFDLEQRRSLTEFGQDAAQCMPKFVQKVQLTAGDELELLISAEGVLCVLDFLKSHHNAQFTRDYIHPFIRLDNLQMSNPICTGMFAHFDTVWIRENCQNKRMSQ